MTEDVVENEIIETVQKDANDENIVYKEIKDPYGFIYITTNLINGTRYIGQRLFTQGWKNYLGSGTVLRRAIKKYGRHNFHREIIFICYSQEELNNVERELTIFFNVLKSDMWYNLVLGGGSTNGYNPSEETRQKMRESRPDVRGDKNPNYGNHKLAGSNNPNYGKKMSYEQKKKISDALSGEKSPWYGKHHKEESKKKIGDANRGKRHSDETKNIISKKAKLRLSDPKKHPMYGKHRSEETKLKLKNAMTGKMSGDKHPLYGKHRTYEEKEKIRLSRAGKYNGVNSSNYTPVYCIELDEIFWGLLDVQKKYGFSRQNITGNCMERQSYAGKHPETQEPLHWKYVYDRINKKGNTIYGAITLKYITEERVNEYLNNLRQKEID